MGRQNLHLLARPIVAGQSILTYEHCGSTGSPDCFRLLRAAGAVPYEVV